MHILLILRLVDVFELQDQCAGFLGTGIILRKPQRIGIRGEGKEIVVPVCFIGRAIFGMAPDALFQHRVPHVSTAGIALRRILADAGWIDGPGISLELAHGCFRIAA